MVDKFEFDVDRDVNKTELALNYIKQGYTVEIHDNFKQTIHVVIYKNV